MIEPAKLLPEVTEIAREAGRHILTIYDEAFDVEHKHDESPLTAADLAAHRVIVERLRALTPEIPVMSEESSRTVFEQRAAWNPLWVVDPLDGTKEFVKRNGEFTVNIALVHDHRPVLGVVHVPVSGVSYCAARSAGAYKEHDGARTPLRVAPLRDAPVRVVGSRSHRGPLLDGYLERLGAHEMVPMGSSLKFCLVAEGRADVYPRLGPTCEWDTAAAQAVVECAGGHVVGVDGSPLRYNARPELLNPHFIVYGDASRNWLAYLAEEN